MNKLLPVILVPVTFKIESMLLAEFKAACRADKLTQRQVIEHGIRQYLDEHYKKIVKKGRKL